MSPPNETPFPSFDVSFFQGTYMLLCPLIKGRISPYKDSDCSMDRFILSEMAINSALPFVFFPTPPAIIYLTPHKRPLRILLSLS